MTEQLRKQQKQSRNLRVFHKVKLVYKFIDAGIDDGMMPTQTSYTLLGWDDQVELHSLISGDGYEQRKNALYWLSVLYMH